MKQTVNTYRPLQSYGTELAYKTSGPEIALNTIRRYFHQSITTADEQDIRAWRKSRYSEEFLMKGVGFCVLGDVIELVFNSHSSAKRVKQIVQGLKSFSRLDGAEISDADLHGGVESTMKVLSNELNYTCDVALDFGELPLIPCNPVGVN